MYSERRPRIDSREQQCVKNRQSTGRWKEAVSGEAVEREAGEHSVKKLK